MEFSDYYYDENMEQTNISKENKITIKDLYPQLNEEELAEAEFNLKRYFEICMEIYHDNEDRIEEFVKEVLEKEGKNII